MKIYFSPCVSIDKKVIDYKFEDERVEVTYNGNTDIFDFSNIEDNKPSLCYPESVLEDDLGISPILEVKRVDGELYVKVLQFIEDNAEDKDCFPDWVSV